MRKFKLGVLALGAALAVGVGAGIALRSNKAVSVSADDSVTLAYTASTTTNMVEGNNAATVGLSATDWNFTANKGGHNLYPGLNKGKYIALYYHANGSNSITLNATNSAWSITSITVSFTGSSYANANVYAGTTATGTAITGTDGTYSIGNNAFTILNANSSNAQVRITSIVVNYSTGGVDPELPELEIWDSSAALPGNYGVYYSISGYLYYAKPAAGGDALSDVTWTSSNTAVAEIADNGNAAGFMTIHKPGVITISAAKEGYKTVSHEVSILKGALEELEVTGSMTKTDYTTSDDWSYAGLVATATYHSGWEEDVASQATWTYNPAKPAKDVTSVVATASYTYEGDTLNASSTAQAVTVTVAHAGTAEDPFTVAEAINKAKAIGTTAQGPWVTKGIISKVTTWDSRYPNITYWISDDGEGTSTTNSVQCYRGKYLEGADITADNAGEFTVGKIVTITGNLVNYNSNTPEYATNNYPLSIETPSTGDIDVTFAPEGNLEIGNTGTFVATTTATNPVYTWSSDAPSVLSVDAATGAYEALALGKAKITVSVTSDDGEGEVSATIVVNSNSNSMTVDRAVDIGNALASGETTEYYVRVGGYISLFDADGKTRALNITNEEETKTIMVFVKTTDAYNAFISGLQLGTHINVKGNIQNYNGTLEIVSPELIDSEYVAMTFAYEFFASTDAICENYDGITDNKAALEAVWSGFKTKYEGLNSAQQQDLLNPEDRGCGNTIISAMERYDYLTGKYNLENFITGRTPTVVNNHYTNPAASNANVNMLAIIIIASVALVTTTGAITAIIIKKRVSR